MIPDSMCSTTIANALAGSEEPDVIWCQRSLTVGTQTAGQPLQRPTDFGAPRRHPGNPQAGFGFENHSPVRHPEMVGAQRPARSDDIHDHLRQTRERRSLRRPAAWHQLKGRAAPLGQEAAGQPPKTRGDPEPPPVGTQKRKGHVVQVGESLHVDPAFGNRYRNAGGAESEPDRVLKNRCRIGELLSDEINSRDPGMGLAPGQETGDLRCLRKQQLHIIEPGQPVCVAAVRANGSDRHAGGLKPNIRLRPEAPLGWVGENQSGHSMPRPTK